MKIVELLKTATQGKTSLSELVDEFERVCRIKIDGIDECDDLIFCEIGTFTFDEKARFYFSLVRQFPNGDDEYYQLHLDVIYDITNDNKDLESCIWSDETEGNFFIEVRNLQEYIVLKNTGFKKIEIYLDET